MHRERPLDFWLTMILIAALFTPIWGVLLEPSQLIKVSSYFLAVVIPAVLVVIGILIYARQENRVLLNRFLTGYAAGLAGSFLVHMFLLAGHSMHMAPNMVGILGKMMLGQPADTPITASVTAAGLVYHYLLNGAAWGSVYALVFGKAPWWIGTIFGLGIAAILLVSPAFYRIGFQISGAQVGALVLISIVFVHFVYGSAVGYIVYRYVFPEVGVEGSRAIKPTYA